MSATEALRANLTALGIEYGRLGDYTTYVTSRGFSWTLMDNYGGTLNARVNGIDPGEAIALITGHGTAHVLSVCDEDGVGHSECDACGGSVNRHDRFCRHCGARFVEATDG